MKRIIILTIATALLLSASVGSVNARGGGGGRSSFGGSRSFSSSKSSFKSSSSRSMAPKAAAAKPKTATQIKAEKAQAAKVAQQKSQQAAKVKAQQVKESKYQSASNKLPSSKSKNGKTYTKGKTVGVNGYNPRYTGYVAPAGSTTYYRSSAMDWFFLYYILAHDSHKEAVVVQPDKTEKVVKEEGVDNMYVFNWIVLILLLGAGGAGIVWLVNKKTS